LQTKKTNFKNMQNNSLKEKLVRGKSVIGTWCEVPSPELVNVIAKSGLDFVIIDMEHGSMDFTTASRMAIAAEVEGCCSIVRVSRNNASDILRSLEIAPSGIIIPHIESERDRVKAVENMKFPPIGNRSLNPYTRAGGYQNNPDYTEKQNKNVLLSLLIESTEGVDNIDVIIDDKNVDLIYIGIYDLSIALGQRGNIESAIVVETLKKLVKIIKMKKKIAGAMFHNQREYKFFKKIGVQFLCYKVDTAVIFDEFKEIVNFAKL